MTTTRRLAVAALGLGLAVSAVTQLVGRSAAPPIYDGVIPSQPYRWLQPPPGQPGGAKGATATVGVSGGQNELVAVATDEIPPQAQVFAGPGGIALAPGTTSLHVSIQPVPPPAQPASGYIDGNVYAFSITDQAGTQLSAVAAAKVTIVMRSAQASLTDGVIERYDGTSWQELGPPGSGLGGFLAVVTAFGDFAVVGLGPSPYATPAATPGAPSGSPGLTITPSISPNPSAGTVESPSASAVPGPPSGGEVPSWLFLVGAAAALTALAASVLWRPARRRSAASRRPPGRGSGSGRPARRRDR